MAVNPYLSGVFGFSNETASLSIDETLNLYRNSLKNKDKETAAIAKDPIVKRDLARLTSAIASAKTPEELLKNPAVRTTLLEGLGLADQKDNTALAIKALMSDTTKTGNLASQLTDARWSSTAKMLDFANSGLKKLKDPKTLQSILDGVVDYRRLTAISDKSQAVADALTVQGLDNKTPNVYTVLGNSVMRRVATTVAGLPNTLALQEVESQARSLNRNFDLREFSTENNRDKLIQKYLVTSAAANSTTSSSSYLLSLFG